MRDEIAKVVKQTIEKKYLNQRIELRYKYKNTVALNAEGPNQVSKVKVEFSPTMPNGYRDERGYKITLTLVDPANPTSGDDDEITLWSVDDL